MAAIDFPNSPTVGQVVTVDNRSWVWTTSSRWELVPFYGIVTATAPIIYDTTTRNIKIDDSMNILNIMGVY